MRSVPNILPSVKFPIFGIGSCFSRNKKEENLGENCSTRTALISEKWRGHVMLNKFEAICLNQPVPTSKTPALY